MSQLSILMGKSVGEEGEGEVAGRAGVGRVGHKFLFISKVQSV